jgi:hypothetical protein
MLKEWIKRGCLIVILGHKFLFLEGVREMLYFSQGCNSAGFFFWQRTLECDIGRCLDVFICSEKQKRFIISSTICLIQLLHGWSGVCQAREAAMTVQGKLVDSQRRKGKGNTRNSCRPCIIELASSAPFLVDYVRPIFHFYNIW